MAATSLSRGRDMVILAALVLLPLAPKLARLAGAIPSADEAKQPVAVAPHPKAATSNAHSTNPRGEPLLFEANSTDVRPNAVNWWSVSVSPDGKRIATSQGDGNDGKMGEVKIWDREKGKVLHTILEPKGVRKVEFSPDGKTLATGNYDGALRIYDAATFALRAATDETNGGHKISVNGLCFFKEGKYLASAGLDNTARVWDVDAILAKAKNGIATPQPVAIFEGHTQGVLSVSVSADGLTLLTGSFDKTARCYDVPDPLPKMGETPVTVKKERVLLQGHNAAVEAVAVSPNGQLLATGSWDAQLLIRDRDGKNAEASLRFQLGVMSLAFSKDGKYLAAGSGNMNAVNQPGEVRVWDVEGKKEAAFRGDYPSAVLGVCFTPDGKTVASVGHGRGLHQWLHAGMDRKTFTTPGLTFTPQPYFTSALSASGGFLAVSGEAKSVYILNRKEGELVAELTGHDDAVAGLAFSPDGKTLATASYDKTIKLWSTETWKERKTLKGHTGWVLGVAFSPDSRTLATGSYDKAVRLWNVETGEPKATWKDHSAGVRSVAFSPDGQKLISGGSDRILRIWDVANGNVLLTLKGHKGAVRSVAFSPDGKSVASGSEDRSVKLWDAENGKETKAFGTLPDMVTAVRFSPKGQTIAATTFQGPIALLDPISGRTRQILRGHSDAATAANFTDEGQRLISVSQDRTIRQWPAEKPSSAAPAQTFAGKIGMIIGAAAIAPDGKFAILGGTDGSLTRWELPGGRVVELPLASPIPGGVVQVAASADGLAAAVGKEGKFWVVPLASGRDTRWNGSGKYVGFTPDGEHLAVADGKDILLYEAATGKETKRFTGGSDNVVRFAFSHDGKRLIAAGEETKVRLWNVETGAKLQETPAFGNYSTVAHLAFSPDGTRFAAAAYGPDQPPPDDMTGQFRLTREVRVFAVPAAPDAPFGNPIVFVPQPTDQPLTGLDWVANGQSLLTPASDGTVRLTELGANGPREVQRFRAHDAAILASAFCLDSGALLTAGEDMAVRRWKLPGLDAPPGQARLTPSGLTRVWEMLPSPDGRYYVTAGEGDKSFRVYAALPSAFPVEPDRHGSAFALAYSPDNTFLVTGHEKGVVVVREAATGKPIRTLSGLAKRVSSIAFAENGAALVAVGGNWMNGDEPGEAIVWNFAAGSVRHKLEAPILQWMVAVAPEGKTAAGAGSDGAIRIWDVASGKLVKTLTKGGPALHSVSYDKSGRRIAAGGFNHRVRIWDVDAETVSIEIATNPDLRISQALFSPDGKEIVVSSWRGNEPSERKPELAAYVLANPMAPPRLFPTHPASITNMAFLPDGKTLVAAGGENNGLGSLRAYDYASAKQLAMFGGHRHWGQSLAVSPDGTRIASTSWGNPADGELRLWDPRGIRPIAEVKVPDEKEYLSCGAIGRGGKLLVLGGWGQTLTAWDMTDPAKPALKKQIKDHAASLRSLAFDDAGTRFVSADESGMVKVWDAATLERIVSFKASANAIYRAKFTPDGKAIVAVGGNDKAMAKGEMRVWDPKTGQPIGRFPDQTREVWDIAFLNGGKQMAAIHALAGSPNDANVKIWDFETKEVVRSLLPPGTFASGRCLGVSPDGKHLAVGSSVGPVKVLETTTWQEVLSIPDITNCTFHVSFTRDGNSLLIASGEGAAIAVRLPQSTRR